MDTCTIHCDISKLGHEELHCLETDLHNLLTLDVRVQSARAKVYGAHPIRLYERERSYASKCDKAEDVSVTERYGPHTQSHTNTHTNTHSTSKTRVCKHENEQHLVISPVVHVHQCVVFLSRMRFTQDQLEYWHNDVGRKRFVVRWIGNVQIEASSGFGEKLAIIAFRVLRLHAQERGPRQTIEVTICRARLPPSIRTLLGTESCCKGFESRMDRHSGQCFVERCQRGLDAVPHNVRGFFFASGVNGLRECVGIRPPMRGQRRCCRCLCSQG